MLKDSEEPVRALRAKVSEERAALEDLRRRFTHQSMKDSVTSALRDLDEVESFFLRRLNEDWRTVAEEAAVIRDAGLPLNLALVKRQYLQEAMEKFGPDAMLIPSK